MRKADYATLAALIRAKIIDDSRYLIGNNTARDMASERIGATKTIARQFADRASVDRAVFLKACGIDP